MSEALVNAILAAGESPKVEFKAEASNLEAIGRSVSSFLNGPEGGTLVVGVTESGRAIGVSDAEAKAKQIQRHLFEHLSPKSPCSVSVVRVRDKRVLLIDVPVGQEQPYVFEDQIYVRDGDQSRHAQPEEIIGLIKQRATRPVTWERHTAPGAELSDLDEVLIVDTAKLAAKRGLKLKDADNPLEVLRQLNLAGAGYILNSAIVLFGKQPQQRYPQMRLRAVVFEKDKSGDFIDRRDFEGNLFVLLDAVEAFVKTHVPVAAKFIPGQMRREDKPAYPFSALREGILNALMHRDYAAFTGGVAISIYPDRLEIWNSGKLPMGLTIADLKREHPSLPPNPDIAQVVYLRELIERVGRGTEKIVSECQAAGLPSPAWKETPVGITLTFFSGKIGKHFGLNQRQRELLAKLKPGEHILPADYRTGLAVEVTGRQARSDLLQLTQAGFLKREGRGRSTAYVRTHLEPK